MKQNCHRRHVKLSFANLDKSLGQSPAARTVVLTRKSIPIVEMNVPAWNAQSLNRTIRHVLPTALSPRRITWGRNVNVIMMYATVEASKGNICTVFVPTKTYSIFVPIISTHKSSPPATVKCKTRNFRKQLIFVNFVNWANLRKFVFSKGFFKHILIGERPNLRKLVLTNQEKLQFTKISRL